ncbi:MAG: cell division ATP-binding protein FtsE [Candidatus Vogelbacteria bacterium CG10_big_fil_rev_8_21_14_0_10_51_16]|uniref:Cell division ATP-binding protein FtsE n=1 Tax=Candidatus Vogelbacteria bacterium CG10_big_fil_rev_8_21_14_0_10_51_16 TaxID=1975045 RepID=A0A2H0RE20_9BACT|nr:MAG: cell division ATP-binding protein FtsE [Candidatus Vogelbacteria bacterium CG10_big_fil_rev_8_21_14_0_10_51_16]
MLYFQKVSKVYPDHSTALHDVTFTVNRGEFLSLVGHSGAGKTTVIKLILGEEAPTKGTVSFESVNIHSLRKKKLALYRRKIGVVFQDFRLIPSKTAYENIAFAMEAAGRTDAEVAADVPDVLELVGLQKKMSNFPRELSGGEKQRVAIARALVNQPELIIADEPTGNLDPINAHEIVQILKKINELGTTVMLTTHNRGVIDDLKRRVITLDDGAIVRDDEHGKYSL